MDFIISKDFLFFTVFAVVLIVKSLWDIKAGKCYFPSRGRGIVVFEKGGYLNQYRWAITFQLGLSIAFLFVAWCEYVSRDL